MYLGIKAVIALAIERIHAANLINFGIVPLIFTDVADYDLVNEGSVIRIENIREQLLPGKPVSALIDGKAVNLTHKLSEEDIRIILAGGMLNCAD